MKLYFHYCVYGFSNCYIIGTDDASNNKGLKEAILVDPGCLDEEIVAFIEENEYTVRGILITHDHENHVRGLKTLKKIYDADVYAVDPSVCEQRATIVRDGDELNIGSFKVRVFSIPGHSADSAVYEVERLLFTGDALTAGLVGSTASAYGRTIQSAAIRNKLLSLPGNYVVLPGHGPLSTLESERQFNAGLEAAEKAGAQRAAFVRGFI